MSHRKNIAFYERWRNLSQTKACLTHLGLYPGPLLGLEARGSDPFPGASATSRIRYDPSTAPSWVFCLCCKTGTGLRIKGHPEGSPPHRLRGSTSASSCPSVRPWRKFECDSNRSSKSHPELSDNIAKQFWIKATGNPYAYLPGKYNLKGRWDFISPDNYSPR